jgi:hypothetical protein
VGSRRKICFSEYFISAAFIKMTDSGSQPFGTSSTLGIFISFCIAVDLEWRTEIYNKITLNNANYCIKT